MKQFIEVINSEKDRVFININSISKIIDKDHGSWIYMIDSNSYIKTPELYNDIVQKISDSANI